ncbi:hypothetical protein [Bacillus thuringiensis]|uniref:hypothetical protein n=1 Tax=Bacillus thuringiensis TaxID=1428 RepID=UPI0015D4A130|nr:hypothetical protein [Bacillus thuringiensis]
MMNFNPFYEWWKRDSYVSWWRYLIGMPLIAIVIGLAWIVITIINVVYGVIDCFKK